MFCVCAKEHLSVILNFTSAATNIGIDFVDADSHLLTSQQILLCILREMPVVFFFSEPECS